MEVQRHVSCRKLRVVAATAETVLIVQLWGEAAGGWPTKAHYGRLPNSARFQEGDQVWLYRPTRTRGKSPKLQPVL